jgi:hypothetical protein
MGLMILHVVPAQQVNLAIYSKLLPGMKFDIKVALFVLPCSIDFFWWALTWVSFMKISPTAL